MLFWLNCVSAVPCSGQEATEKCQNPNPVSPRICWRQLSALVLASCEALWKSFNLFLGTLSMKWEKDVTLAQGSGWVHSVTCLGFPETVDCLGYSDPIQSPGVWMLVYEAAFRPAVGTSASSQLKGESGRIHLLQHSWVWMGKNSVPSLYPPSM